TGLVNSWKSELHLTAGGMVRIRQAGRHKSCKMEPLRSERVLSHGPSHPGVDLLNPAACDARSGLTGRSRLCLRRTALSTTDLENGSRWSIASRSHPIGHGRIRRSPSCTLTFLRCCWVNATC